MEALARGDIAGAPVTDAERELLEVAEKITCHAYRIVAEDMERLRAHGWTDPQIAEMVYVAALFAFFNRVADSFGLVSEGYGGPRPEWGE